MCLILVMHSHSWSLGIKIHWFIMYYILIEQYDRFIYVFVTLYENPSFIGSGENEEIPEITNIFLV